MITIQKYTAGCFGLNKRAFNKVDNVLNSTARGDACLFTSIDSICDALNEEYGAVMTEGLRGFLNYVSHQSMMLECEEFYIYHW